MGVLQALETIKVITMASSKLESNGDANDLGDSVDRPSLHIFSAYSTPPFRTIRLRSRRANCAVCSDQGSVTLDSLRNGSTDYVQFCGSANPPQLLSPEERISAVEYQPLHLRSAMSPATGPASKLPSHHSPTQPFTLIDVRDKVQFDICNLENSINVPISTILTEKKKEEASNEESKDIHWPSWLPPDVAAADSRSPIYVVCRLGNDSQLAVRKLKELGLDQGGKRFIGDIRGGFKAWKAEVDPEWPEY
jgi:adenylyltransferase/sulfurtransferase